MIKPERLRKGDKVAFVSLSSGLLGEPALLHKYHIAKKRLEDDFGLEVVCMEHALSGLQYISEHPEARAEDMMNAFRDPSIKGVFCAIGGDDTIRLLPYIDFDVLRDNPKIFTGFSDTTVNHFMLNKVGVCSYYGASVMCDLAEYVAINDYSRDMIVRTLFEPQDELVIPPSPYCCYEGETIRWSEDNTDKPQPYKPDGVGYELLCGSGTAEGELLGGCIDVFPMFCGTTLWPSPDEWRGKILCLETSEDHMRPCALKWLLRGLAAQGIFRAVSGVLVGKPAYPDSYEPYKETLREVIVGEEKLTDLPVLYNVNFGHSSPRCVLPFGIRCRIDCAERSITLLEPATL